MDKTMWEPARELPVLDEADICVLGGSCTGLFAAVRAARIGARVVIVEQANCFGGVATISGVNAWHSLMDTEFRRPIIGGLTQEVVDRLGRRGAVEVVSNSASFGFVFNSAELKIELDELATESRLSVWFHTTFSAPLVIEGQLSGVVVESKSGRGVIKARMFIDATGDGDLCARLPGIETYRSPHPQPATLTAHFEGWRGFQKENQASGLNANSKDWELGTLLKAHGEEFGLPQGFTWGTYVPGSDLFMLSGTRVFGADPTDARQLTRAEIEGRRQVRAIHDLLRKYCPENKLTLESLPSKIGLRESRHVRCAYQLTGDDVLFGRASDDAVAYGSYRSDVHHHDKPGITLRYLDGTEEYAVPGQPKQRGRWRPETQQNPTYYQVPYRSLVPRGPYENVLAAGRMLDADPLAHAAVRVMVNTNQTGEAVGTAAVLALREGKSVGAVEVTRLRAALQEGGSVFPQNP